MKKADELLDGFITELSTTDEKMFSVRHPLQKGEKVIATIDDPLIQKVYALAMYYARENAQGQLTEHFDGESAEATNAMRRAKQLNEMYMEMFWMLTREVYNLWAYPSVGIRKNWQVVDLPERGGPPEIIRAIFGGDS
jgi:hypothetical protein